MFLGHHSPAFTLAAYVHLLPDDLPDAPPLADVDHSVDHSVHSLPALETRKPAVAGIS